MAFTTDLTQSIHSAPNGIETRIKTARPIHHPRSRTPRRANGNSDGLMRTPRNAHLTRNPSATAAIAHITGFPATILATNGGQNTQSARNGHATGDGLRRQTTAAVVPRGTAHHSTADTTAGRTANGTKSRSALGGYRTSPICRGYGPAS